MNMTDYEREAQDFRWIVPERFNFCRDTFDPHSSDGEKLAMLWVDEAGMERRLTFADFVDRSKRLAGSLQGLGVRKGDRVLLIAPRLVEWWESSLACLRAGIVASPGTTQLTPKDIAYRLQQSEAVAVVTDADGAAKVDEALALGSAELRVKMVIGDERNGWLAYEEALERSSSQGEAADTRADDPALLYFTSGTTGNPKMTVHTQASYGIGHLVTGKYWLDLTPEDLHWNMSDTGWAKVAWSSFFGPWIIGATVFSEHSVRFDPERTLNLLSHYPITTMCGAPTVYRMLVQEDLSSYKFPALRHCVAAGEPLNPEVIDVWKKATGLTIRDGYGQTETTLLVGSFPSIEPRPGSMGKPTPGYHVSIIDDDGNGVPTGTEGDIAVRVSPDRPAGLFKEYWKEPERTKSSFNKDWYLTGDRAYRDEDGYFWFVGRADDVIISAGYRIGPFEIESALVEHPAVAESAVVASPDPVRGQIVKAFVVLAKEYEPSQELVDELQQFVKERTAPYKYPRKVEFVDDVPKTISGKIRRVDLRQRELQRKGE